MIIANEKYSLHEILNAIFYLLKTDCQWGMLPKWELGYYYYQKWRDDGTIEQIHEILRAKLRKRAGKQESPSLAVMIHNQVIQLVVEEYTETLMVVKM